MNGEFMKEALSLAKAAAEENEVPVGAVIVKDGKIIARAKNSCEKSKSALCHAELIAIAKAGEKLGTWRLQGCKLYVTLEPCAMCAGAIINSQISKVIFGAYDEKGGACLSKTNLFEKGLGYTPQIIGGYMEEECSALLSEFFKNKR